MKSLSAPLGIAVMLALLISVLTASGQTAPVPTKNFTGQILKVDVTTKIMTVKDPDGLDMTFSYNDDTRIISTDKSARGLAGKEGSRVLITYYPEKGVNRATQIEFIE